MGTTQEAPGKSTAVGVGFRQRLQPQPAAVARARLLVRSFHGELPPLGLLYVELVVCELVTNAVVHAATPLEVRVAVARTVHVAVSDGSSAPPVRLPATSGHPDGGGLQVVETFARRWGFEERVGGKVVWAELDVHPGETDDAIQPHALGRPQRGSRQARLALV